jgi:predicted ATPase
VIVIKSLEITDEKNLPTPWWAKVKTLKKVTELTFKPGINVIVGRNAAGKSTVITLLARHFHCEEDGITCITESSLSTLFKKLFEDDPYPDGYKVRHDGQPVGYFSPDDIIGSGATFNYNFLEDDLNNRMMKASQGQKTMMNVMRTVEKLRKTEKLLQTMNEKYVNDLWANRIRIVKKLLKGTGPKGQKTLLLDEPERSLDLENEIVFFQQLRKMDLQVIMATHSVFAFMMKDVNFIELNRGYVKSIRAKLEEMGLMN